MATIRLHQTTTATPGQLLAGLTDFGPGRSKIFRNSADGYLKVHFQGPGQADVTEGSDRRLGTPALRLVRPPPHHHDHHRLQPVGRTVGAYLHADAAARRDDRRGRRAWSARAKTSRGGCSRSCVATGGKRVLAKALAKTVKAIEARNYPDERGEFLSHGEKGRRDHDPSREPRLRRIRQRPAATGRRSSERGAEAVLSHGQHADLRQRGRGAHGPRDDGRSGARARQLGRRQGPQPDRHLHHPRPRRSLVRRRAAGRAVRGARRRLRGHDHADARQRGDAAAAVGQAVSRGSRRRRSRR